MNLLLITRKIWDYRLVTLPVIALVLVGAFYVLLIQPPTYEASATYILVPAPPAPTDAQIARDPSLGRARDSNPYSRFSDPSVLVQVLSSRLNSNQVRASLAAQGVDAKYTAEPSAAFGFSSPILQITGSGETENAAVRTANLVGRAMTQELDVMQEVRGVDKNYRITTEAVVPATEAQLKPSGKVRSLVAVFGLGAVLLFLEISVLDAVGMMRREGAFGARRDEEPWDTEGAAQGTRDPLDEEPHGADRGSAWEAPLSSTDLDSLPWTSEVQR